MEKDLIKQSITKTYRPSIWSRFIKALKEFHLLKENDSLALLLSLKKEDLLLAKLFDVLKMHSDFNFEIDYFCLNKDAENLKDNISKLNIDVKLISNFEEINKEYILIDNITYDDVINFTLKNLLFKGEYVVHLPIYNKDNRKYINPLYYIRDKDIDNFIKYNNIDAIEKNKTKEDMYIDKLIKDLLKQNEFIEKNIFKSALNVNTDKILGYKDESETKSFLSYYEKNRL